MTWNNGVEYRGDFDCGTISGQGRMNFCKGDCYEGGFFQNLPQGKGIYIYRNGDKYEGEFNRGIKEGKGVFENSNEGLIYDGEWINDLPNGNGTVYISISHYKIEGIFANGKIIEIKSKNICYNNINITIMPLKCEQEMRELTHLMKNNDSNNDKNNNEEFKSGKIDLLRTFTDEENN